MADVTAAVMVLLGTAGGLCLAALIRRPSTADRIVALDTLLVVTVMTVAVVGVRQQTAAYVPFTLVAALLAFIGTVTVARYIEGRGT